MKTQFLNTNDFHLAVEVRPVSAVEGHCHLSITSQWLKANDPAESRVRLELTLDAVALNTLIAALQRGAISLECQPHWTQQSIAQDCEVM